MSELSKKYNIPAETVHQMVKDGVISCSWGSYEEICNLYSSGMSTADIAFKFHMTQRNVQYIIKKIK